MTDPSGAQEGLDQVEQAAEQAAQKTASAAAKAADSVVSETEEAAQKAAAAVKSAAGKGEKEAADAGAKVRKTSKETSDKVGTDADSAGQKTQRSAKETKEKVVSQFTAGQVAIGNIISKCVDKVVDVGKTLISTGVSYNAEIEKYRTALTNLLGDAEKANAALAAMQADAARTPFDTATLVKSNEYLISAGENAEYSRKTILALGDAVAATGGGSAELERMAQNLQQVANQGKATSVDIKQFAMAGINIYQVLADYTGKSVQDVQSMTITYDVLTQALQAAAEEGGRYYDSMATQSQTLNGRLSTLKDNATQLAGVVMEDLTTAFGEAVTKCNDLAIACKEGWQTNGIDGLLDAVRETTPELSVLADAVQLIKDNFALLATGTVTVTTAVVSYKAATALATTATAAYSLATTALNAAHLAAASGANTLTVAQVALNAVMAANPIGAVVAVVATLTAGIATARATSETFAASWDTCMSGLKSAADFAVNSVLTTFNMLWSAIKGIAAAIAAMPDGPKAVLDAYNSAYAASRDEYKQNRNAKDWDNAHEGMEWDDDNGWVPKGTSSSGNGSSRGAAVVVSDIPSSSGSSGTKKTSKKATETVLRSTTDNYTIYSQNALGQVETTVEAVNEHIRDSTGKEFDRLTEKVTESGKEMVNGVEREYTLVTTKVDGVTQKVTKSYADMSKVLTDTAKKTSTSYKDGATVTTAEVTKIYADGSRHVEQTVTEAGERIGASGRETYEKIITYVDGVQDKVEESAQQIDTSVTATQKRIDEALSGAKSELSSGIFGIIKDGISAVKNKDWAGIAETVTKLIWGQVSQSQRDTVSAWAKKALAAINEAYAGGGLQGAFGAVSGIFGSGIKNGAGATIQGIGEIASGLSGSGGMGKLVGAAVSGIGTIGKAVAGLVGKVGGLIAAHPEVFAIIALVAGIAGLGLFLWKKYGRKGGSADDGSASDETPALPHPDSSGYTQSDTITAAELTRRTQAASAANQQSISRTQNSTGSSAAQQLTASYTGSLTAVFNVDGREMARTTASYMDEELGFRR